MRYVDRFQQTCVHAAKDAGVDGVLYCNDGDWVESCTALVEDRGGELSLVTWPQAAVEVAAFTMPVREVA